MLVFFIGGAAAIFYIGDIAYRFASEIYGVQRAKYDEFLIRKDNRQALYDEKFDQYSNILLIGLDEGKEVGGTQADSIIVVSLDKDSGKVRVILLPRYTKTEIEGVGTAALNLAYQHNGVPLLEKTVAKVLGITIHHYVLVNPQVVADIVDILGGIDVYAAADMQYQDPEAGLVIDIPKGINHLNGDLAQKYLRYSSDDLGNLGTLYRQEKFLETLYEMILSPSTVAKLPELVEVLEQDIVLTTEVYDAGEIAGLLATLDTSGLEMVILPGSMDMTGAWNIDEAELQALRERLFPVVVPKEESEDGGGWFSW